MIDECERVLDTELGLPSDPLESLAEVWEALNDEITTRQGCAKSLGERLDALADRLAALEAK
jgi:polyhydroxyalkanoate synthesis regulator phasin